MLESDSTCVSITGRLLSEHEGLAGSVTTGWPAFCCRWWAETLARDAFAAAAAASAGAGLVATCAS